ERFYPHLLTTIVGRKWLLTYEMKLAIVKCMNLPDCLSALGIAISKAIEKGMQDGLPAGITRGKEGRVLTDVAAYNPSAVRGSCFPSRSLNLYAPFPSASVTSYASCIAASSVLSSKRSRLISKASLFCTRSISVVLSVGMPISARMTTYVLYVKENGVSQLLDFIIVWCTHST
nr:cold-regulated 47 [Tanacetum cinerariifolium]